MNENLNPNWIGNEEDEIYRENILDHFKNPRNFGFLENSTINHKELNPVCGDQIEMFLHIKDNKIENVKFNGGGCAISIASASMLTERIKGINLMDLKNITKEEVLKMIGVPLGIVRGKCGLLSLKVLIKCIEEIEVKNEQTNR